MSVREDGHFPCQTEACAYLPQSIDCSDDNSVPQPRGLAGASLLWWKQPLPKLGRRHESHSLPRWTFYSIMSLCLVCTPPGHPDHGLHPVLRHVPLPVGFCESIEHPNSSTSTVTVASVFVWMGEQDLHKVQLPN